MQHRFPGEVQGYERFLYDEARGYTVGRYLSDVKARYGGVDAVLLWPTYTNLGLDDRNQVDMPAPLSASIPGIVYHVGMPAAVSTNASSL